LKFSFDGRKRDLCDLLHCLCRTRPILARVVTYAFKGVSFTAEGKSMGLVVSDTDVPGTVQATVSFTDAKGNPATVDGAPTWDASNPAVIDSIIVAPDGMSAKLHITDKVGASNVTVSADVDLGSGVDKHDFVDTVSVIGGAATAAAFAFGAVTPDGGTPPPPDPAP
jgi:hypothetical protein